MKTIEVLYNGQSHTITQEQAVQCGILHPKITQLGLGDMFARLGSFFSGHEENLIFFPTNYEGTTICGNFFTIYGSGLQLRGSNQLSNVTRDAAIDYLNAMGYAYLGNFSSTVVNEMDRLIEKAKANRKSK